MIPELNLLPIVLRGLSTDWLSQCSPSSPGAYIVSYLLHTYGPFLPTTLQALQEQVPCYKSSTRPHIDSFPSSPCAPIVSMLGMKWFHIQQQKLSQGRTDACPLTQYKGELSFQ